MATLVLGGAGYIGSHMVDLLLQDGRDVVVVDNLLTGHRKAVPAGVPFYEVDIRDKDAMRDVFKKENITQVVHFAASSIVPESMENPLKYFDNKLTLRDTECNMFELEDLKKIITVKSRNDSVLNRMLGSFLQNKEDKV